MSRDLDRARGHFLIHTSRNKFKEGRICEENVKYAVVDPRRKSSL